MKLRHSALYELLIVAAVLNVFFRLALVLQLFTDQLFEIFIHVAVVLLQFAVHALFLQCALSN